MKRLFVILFLGFLMLEHYVFAQGISTKLIVNVNGFALGKELFLRGDCGVFQTETDADGLARFELSLAAPTYFTLSISTSENQIYLIPGKELMVTLIPELKEIKGKERKLFNLDRLDLKFEGETASINEFLNQYVMEELPPDAFLMEQAAYIKRMEKAMKKNRKTIDGFELDNSFKESEYLRMKYRLLEALTRYPIQHYWPGGSQVSLIYDHGEDLSLIYNYIMAELKDDEELWKNKEYRRFFSSAIGTLTGIYGKKDSDKMFMARLEKALSIVKSRMILEDYVQELALNYVDMTESDSLHSLKVVYEQYVKNKAYQDELEKAMAAWKKSSVGAEFSDGESAYVDIDGKAFSFASLKGKYVYIDVWATWCGPCRQELPYLVKLEEKFHDKNIAFVSISVDNRMKDWSRMVVRNKMAGIQLYGGPQAPIMKDFQISGIPRFLLLDRDGRVINPDMTRPSDSATDKFLNELEGI